MISLEIYGFTIPRVIDMKMRIKPRIKSFYIFENMVIIFLNYPLEQHPSKLKFYSLATLIHYKPVLRENKYKNFNI